MSATKPPPNEVNVLGSGTVSRRGVQGAFAQNVFFRHDAMEVRLGFGQMAQFDTSASLNPTPGTGETDFTTDWGYRKHLGSKLIKTDFGNLQLVSVYLTTIASGSTLEGSIGADVYAVSIYDIDQNTRWEEIIYRHTSENNADKFPMPMWHGHYETSGRQSILPPSGVVMTLGYDYQDWVHAIDEPFFFQEYRDILFFGNRASGLLAYRPCLFHANVPKFVNKHHSAQWMHGYSESAVVTRAIPSPGLFEEGIAYFTKDEFPKPVAITALEGRLVYASGKSLYFSDAGFPTNIAADNYITIESESDIVALAHVQGNLVVLTADETWMYHPSVGFLWSSGRLNRISSHVGCVGPSAIKRVGGKIWWFDKKGIYSTTGNTLVEHESDAIDNYWRGKVTSPVSHYHGDNTNPGHAASWALSTQPKTTFVYEGGPVHLTHDSQRDLIIFSVPEEDLAWCLSDNGNWSLWNFESVTYSEGDGSAKVRAVKNITSPWIESRGDRMFLAGGPEAADITDSAKDGTGTDLDDDVRSSSYYILEYGRGGGIDRSSYDHEDDITVAGKWVVDTNPSVTEGVVYLGEWIPVPAGYRCPAGNTFATAGYLVPVYLGMPSGVGLIVPDRIAIAARFDNTKWKPVVLGATGEVDFLLPPERLGSESGYSQGAPAVNTRFQIYDNTGGSFSEDGEELVMHWDGASGAGWSHAPAMNLNWGGLNLIAYLPMQRLAANTDSVSGMGWTSLQATVTDVGVSSVTCRGAYWKQYELDPADRARLNQKAQAVDWIYKTDNINETEALRIRSRGLWVRTLSHGDGDASSDDTLYQYYTPKLFGVAVAADGREYLAQGMAYTEKSTDATFRSAQLLSREVRTTQGQIRHTNGTLVEKLFSHTVVVTYGDIADNDTGTYYIDDEEIMDQKISANVDGQRVSYIMYGATRHRGHRLAILEARALIQVLSESQRRIDRRT